MRPQEARELARRVPGLRRSERELLALLLRLTRDGSGAVTWPRGTKAIADDLDYSTEAVKLARRALVSRGLVLITQRGLGAVRTSYRVDLAAVRSEGPETHPGEGPVNTRENPFPPSPEVGPPLPQGGVTSTPRSGRHYPTYTRARLSPVLSGSTPLPPASGGSMRDARCPKAEARGSPCESCRACGTTPRQVAAAATSAAKQQAVAARLAEQLARRQQVEAARAERAAERARTGGPSPGYLAARAAVSSRNPTDREALA